MPENNDINNSSAGEAEIQAEQERRNEGNKALETFTKEHLARAKEQGGAGIDDLVRNLKITANNHAEQEELARAEAVTSLKKYVEYTYRELLNEIKRLKSPEERKQWAGKLKEAQKNVNDYTVTMSAFVHNFQRELDPQGKKKEEVDLKALWELGQKGNEVFEQMIQNKAYGEILQKVTSNKLDKPSFDFIYEKIQRRTSSGPLSPKDAIKLLEQAGVTSILGAMGGKQRMDFAEHVIDSGKPDALAILTSFVGSGYLSMGQADRLVDRAIAKGLMPASQKQAVLASMLSTQEKSAEFEKGIADRLERPQYKSQLHRVMEPKFLGGLFLTAWRGINLLATCMAYRKDWKELLGSPYVYADVAGILAGTALMGNPTILEFLEKATKGQKNEKEHVKRLAELMALTSRYDTTSKRYFEKGGTIEAITAIRKEHAISGKKKISLVDEIKIEAKKQYVVSKNPNLSRDLETMNPEELRQFTIIADKIYETPSMIATKNYEETAKVTRKAEGLIS